MDVEARLRYLDALGVESWVLRGAESEQDADLVPETAPPPTAAADPVVVAARGLPAPESEPETEVEYVTEAPAIALEPVAEDWDGLRQMVSECRRCGLCETRTQAVFGVGPRQAPLMVVGEGPGADEDRLGEPFVGRAGKLLDQMLAAIGYSRSENVYIANVVKCRPPGNRDPQEVEAEACRPYLEQQLRLVQPRLIVTLGRVAAQRLLNSSEPLARLRGTEHQWGPDQTPLWATYHPAYLLRSPAEKAKAWADLKKIRRFLEAVK